MENQITTAPQAMTVAPGSWHQEARDMRQNGATFRQIAAKFNVSVTAAYFAINPHARRATKPKAQLSTPETGVTATL
jgi:orotate phosphoribosyltransferase-like protein